MSRFLRLLIVGVLLVSVACNNAAQDNPAIEPTDAVSPTETQAPGGAQTGNTDLPADCRAVPGGGDAVEVEAEDSQFDTNCLQVAANTAFRVELKNRDDGVSHTWSLYDNAGGSAPRFKGDAISGRQDKVYDVPAQPAGVYRFQCDIHPSMQGQLHAT